MTSAEAVVRPELLGEPLPVELMNTINVGAGGADDVLGDLAGVAAWLNTISDRLSPPTRALVIGDGPSPGELDESAVGPIAEPLRGLRDALRRLAAEVTRDPRTPAATPVTHQDAVDTVNRQCALAPAWPEMTWPVDGDPALRVRSTGRPVDHILSLIAEQATELFTGEQRRQLAACLAPGCDRYFLKVHPRKQWCSALCGNRARVARHYQRHHASAASAGEAAG